MEFLMTDKGIKSRAVAHEKGYVHSTVHCLFFDDEYILLQKRADNKKSFAGLYDITVSGHVQAGESLEQAMAKEIEEEIGLAPDLYECEPYGLEHEELVPNDKETAFLHTVKVDNLDNFDFKITEEVSSYAKVKIKDFRTFVKCGIASGTMPANVVPHSQEYWNRFLGWVIPEAEIERERSYKLPADYSTYDITLCRPMKPCATECGRKGAPVEPLYSVSDFSVVCSDFKEDKNEDIESN